MAYNGRTLSDCLPLTSPEEDAARLEAFLKEGEAPPGDLQRDTTGRNPDPYMKQPDRTSGNIDALWGDPDRKQDDPSGTSVHHSNVVLEEFVRGREEFLNRMFANKKPSQQADHALLGSQLQHAATGDYEASHAMPQAASKLRPVPVPSLLQRTKKLLNG